MGVANDYHPHQEKNACWERNGKKPSTPSTASTSIPEVLLDKASSGGSSNTQPSTTFHQPPPFALKVGDRVEYMGTNRALRKQYAGVLEVKEIDPIEGYACWTPNKEGVTSWLQAVDLRLVKD